MAVTCHNIRDAVLCSQQGFLIYVNIQCLDAYVRLTLEEIMQDTSLFIPCRLLVFSLFWLSISRLVPKTRLD